MWTQFSNWVGLESAAERFEFMAQGLGCKSLWSWGLGLRV